MSNDNQRLTPVEIARRLKCRWLLVLGIILVLAIVYWLVAVNQYVVAYKDDVDHFVHGSIGSETATGPPYWVFKALPVMYADRLDHEGWGYFGFLYEKPGDDLPMGVSRRVVTGIDRVWLNCAVCHVGTYHLAGNPERRLIVGAPANNFRIQEVIQFFADVGRDPGFTADKLIAAIQSRDVGGHLNILERLVYRYVVYPRVKAAFLSLGDTLAFVSRQEPWGPGRVDTFNPYKALQFNFPMDEKHISATELNGSSDYPAIWEQRPREGMDLHWDGNNNSVAERNLSAALGAGVTPVTVDRPSLQRIEGWLKSGLKAPVFPVAASIDTLKAAAGRKLYAGYCADCHGMKAAGSNTYDYDTRRYRELGKTVPLGLIGTDAGRWASYTENFAAAQNLLYAGYDWRFSHFRKTDGYASQPLDGIWARSPYLHNGSVPTLRDLLEPASKRPTVWYRGSDELDIARVGYRSDERAPGTHLFRFDTSRPGNGNAGHDGSRYGTELSAAEKDALVEYMKTL